MTTGKDIIRRALANRAHMSQGFGSLRNDLQVNDEALHAFIGGADNLSNEALDALAKFVWGGMVAFDPATDAIRPAVQPPARSLPSYGSPPVLKSLPLRPAGQPPPAFPLPPERTGQPYSKPSGWEWPCSPCAPARR